MLSAGEQFYFNFPKTESPAYLLPGKASFMGSVRANKPEAT
jgi:hypothetical protein